MQKKILTNIVWIRLFLVVLLVFYHSFAIYSGSWTPIEGFPRVNSYIWMARLSYAFMLEMFVFVSGYIFGFQVRTKGKEKLQFKNLFWSKFKRLMIPSIIFSAIYIFMFRNEYQHPLHEILYYIIAGTGHLWFLSMLFWCFIFLWCLESLKIGHRIALPILLVLSIFSFIPLPFHMTNTLYYMLFFYVGYILQRKDINVESYIKPKYALICSVLFVVLFILLITLRANVSEYSSGWTNPIISKILYLSYCNFSKITYASIGLSATFIWVCIYDRNKKGKLTQKVLDISGLCMGVYVFQQFILKALYYHTPLPSALGPYWLPWIGFTIALLASLVLSWLLHKTKIGRMLIG